MSTNSPTSTSVRTTSWILALVAVVCLGSAVALAASFGSMGKSAAAHVNPVPVVPAASIVPARPSATPSPSHHVTPAPKPAPEKPSEAVKLLQRELGQLNYYEGKANGFNTPATIDAIKDLQRDAKLSRTGLLDVATQAALINFLVNGNSQMGK
jgi:peptidoglycan hydrolase-like protein with peptidoglycan-binding domain